MDGKVLVKVQQFVSDCVLVPQLVAGIDRDNPLRQMVEGAQTIATLFSGLPDGGQATDETVRLVLKRALVHACSQLGITKFDLECL